MRLAPVALVALLAAAGTAAASVGPDGFEVADARAKMQAPFKVEDRLAEFGDSAKARLAPHFMAAGVPFPPEAVTLLTFKDARRVELYARGGGKPWTFIRAYPLVATSGGLGPKLRAGDEQVPEGIYRVTFLNPNSKYHVSLRLDYPNEFDLRMARAEGRVALGGDIMIHGKDRSNGCLAMGDAAAEELFTLAALVTPGQVKVIISPTDFRTGAFSMTSASGATWVYDLYRQIETELAQYRGSRL
jgi:hypothetical protein